MTGKEEGITIGMDMGDKDHKAVVIDADGLELERREVSNTEAEVAAFLGGYAGATLAIETGTHCRWVGALASRLGLDVLVANARKVEAIWRSSRKNDWRDAQMLAKLARTDRSLLNAVKLRSADDQRLMRLAKARDSLVRCRVRIVNQVRGICKSEGARLRKCSTERFFTLKGEVPAEVADVACHLFETLEHLNEKIRAYEGILREAVMRLRKGDAEAVMQISGVGEVTAAVFLAAVGDAGRFGKPRDAGAYLGLTPRQSQSGTGDPQLRITKEGNAMARRILVTAANGILGRKADSDIRRFGMRIAERGGKNARKRAKVAMARKLAVTMTALLRNGQEYRPLSEGTPAACAKA
jgi:transposase